MQTLDILGRLKGFEPFPVDFAIRTYNFPRIIAEPIFQTILQLDRLLCGDQTLEFFEVDDTVLADNAAGGIAEP